MTLLRVVYGDDEAVNEMLLSWAADKLAPLGSTAQRFRPCRCAGVLRGDQLVAAVVYHSYSPEWGTVQMSMASVDPRWCSRGVLMELLEIPFRMGCQRIWALTREDNERSMKMLKRLGFVREGSLVGFFGSRHNGVSWRMMKGDYRRFLGRMGRKDASDGR